MYIHCPEKLVRSIRGHMYIHTELYTHLYGGMLRISDRQYLASYFKEVTFDDLVRWMGRKNKHWKVSVHHRIGFVSAEICLLTIKLAVEVICLFSWAHSFGQFKKHALLKACTRSPCFSYTRPARAFISAGLADLSSFGGIGVGWVPDLPCRLSVYDRAKMRPVFANCRPHRLPMTILYKINVVAFFI